MGWQIGGAVGFWINYGVSTTMEASHEQWIIPFAMQLIPGGMMFIGLFLIKESPRWLMTRNRREKALKNLCWIRKLERTDIYMLEEVSAIDAALEDQQSIYSRAVIPLATSETIAEISIFFIEYGDPIQGIPLESMDRLFSEDLTPTKAHKILMKGLREDEKSFRNNVEGSGIGLDEAEVGEKAAHLERL